MDLKKLLLLKLVCCGGPLLVLLVPWAAVSGAIALLGRDVWYLVAASLAAAGALVWESRRRRRTQCDIGRVEGTPRLRGHDRGQRSPGAAGDALHPSRLR